MQQTPKQIKSEQRSMMLAMVLVIAVLFGFQYLKKTDSKQSADASIKEEVNSSSDSHLHVVPIQSTAPVIFYPH